MVPRLSSVSEQQTRHGCAARIAIRPSAAMLTKHRPLRLRTCTSCLQRGVEPDGQTRSEVPRHVRCVQESHTAQALCLRRNDTVIMAWLSWAFLASLCSTVVLRRLCGCCYIEDLWPRSSDNGKGPGDRCNRQRRRNNCHVRPTLVSGFPDAQVEVRTPCAASDKLVWRKRQVSESRQVR